MREQLESNHRENQAMGKEGETDHRHHKHSSLEKKNWQCGNSEVLLVALFAMWSALRLYHGTSQVQFSECSAAEYSRVK
jgi:hypothetical protein